MMITTRITTMIGIRLSSPPPPSPPCWAKTLRCVVVALVAVTTVVVVVAVVVVVTRQTMSDVVVGAETNTWPGGHTVPVTAMHRVRASGRYVTPATHGVHTRSDVVVGALLCSVPGPHGGVTPVQGPLPVLNDDPTAQLWHVRSDVGVTADAICCPAPHGPSVGVHCELVFALAWYVPVGQATQLRSPDDVGAVSWNWPAEHWGAQLMHDDAPPGDHEPLPHGVHTRSVVVVGPTVCPVPGSHGKRKAWHGALPSEKEPSGHDWHCRSLDVVGGDNWP
mmetsp:Transcript_15094/g.38782  ORF Transcript_15094/g.38782 Transcript_15094/m.38782 type:complete len:278 (-) Transcript_15094:4413-5246(-)